MRSLVIVGTLLALGTTLALVPTRLHTNYHVRVDDGGHTLVVTPPKYTSSMSWQFWWDRTDFVSTGAKYSGGVEHRGVPAGTPAHTEWRVQWHVVVVEQAVILLLGGGLLALAIRRNRRRRQRQGRRERRRKVTA